MKFQEIPLHLKRYSFESKMNTTAAYSRLVMDVRGLKPVEKLRSMYLPWELEVFGLFSVIFDGEYSYNRINDRKNIKKFNEFMLSIREYVQPEFLDKYGKYAFIDYFMMVTLLTQAPLQEDVFYRYYRYQYIFSFSNDIIDMEHEFLEKFGVSFRRFLEFGYKMNFLYGIFSESNIDLKAVAFLLNQYNDVASLLSMDRDGYAKKHKDLIGNIDRIMYCFKYTYQYPIVMEHDKAFIPLPHLLLQSTTTSLIFRLTEGNNDLRARYGKEVLENYLYHLFSLDSNVSELSSEIPYGKGTDLSLDVMCRYDEVAILADSKAFAPGINIRLLDEEAIDKSIARVAKSIVQVYKHITERFLSKYNPFQIESYIKENIFGIVVLSEDNFIRRERIYEKACDLLDIEIESEEHLYMCSNIRIASLYTLESMIFGSHDIVKSLLRVRDDSNLWWDYNLVHDENDSKYIEQIIATRDEVMDIVNELRNDLVNNGYVS